MATHDYTRPTWGHAVTVLAVERAGERLRVCGFGHRVEDGDMLLLPNGEETTRYRVELLRRCRDPQDQWFAELSFAPRKGGE